MVENKIFTDNDVKEMKCQGAGGLSTKMLRLAVVDNSVPGAKTFRARDRRIEGQTCFKGARSLGRKEEAVMRSQGRLAANPRCR